VTADRRGVPLYDDLPMSDVGGRHSWDVPCCQTVGTIGFISKEIRLAAASSIVSGDLVSLNAPLNVVTPPFFGRSPLRREYVVKWDGLMLEDWVDSLYLQVSSQWDGLNHVGAAPHLFYGGTTLQQQISGEVNGVDVWARHGIAGRGVLVDVVPAVLAREPGWLPGSPTIVRLNDVRGALAATGTPLRFGDILLIHTGFLDWYRGLGERERTAMREAGPQLEAVGLEHSEDVARFLWDGGIAAVASDSVGVEAWPPIREVDARPFGFLHLALIGHLGMAIGELWELAPLVERCRRRGRWDFFLTSAPLNLPGGVGTPANALAVL
jgi:kynurenine formamidase